MLVGGRNYNIHLQADVGFTVNSEIYSITLPLSELVIFDRGGQTEPVRVNFKVSRTHFPIRLDLLEDMVTKVFVNKNILMFTGRLVKVNDTVDGSVEFEFLDLSSPLYTLKGNLGINGCDLNLTFSELVNKVLNSVGCDNDLEIHVPDSKLHDYVYKKSFKSLFSNENPSYSLDNIYNGVSSSAWDFIYRVSEVCGLRCFVVNDKLVIQQPVASNDSSKSCSYEFVEGVNCFEVSSTRVMGKFKYQGIEVVNIHNYEKRNVARYPNVNSNKVVYKGDTNQFYNQVIPSTSVRYEIINVCGVYSNDTLNNIAKSRYNEANRYSNTISFTTSDLILPNKQSMLSIRCGDYISMQFSAPDLSAIKNTGLDYTKLCITTLSERKVYKVIQVIHSFNIGSGYRCSIEASGV